MAGIVSFVTKEEQEKGKIELQSVGLLLNVQMKMGDSSLV